MLLTVDIGNTNIVLGAYKNKRLISKHRILSDKNSKLPDIRQIDAAIIGSVVPELTASVSKKLKAKYGITPLIVKWKDMDIKIALPNKAQIGIDRLINAYAAIKLYGKPVIIIDFGTATTFCAIDGLGVYRGGAITSGLAISRDVLYERTAKLPSVTIKKPKRAIGTNTTKAMQSGLFYGYVDMVNGLIRRIKRELGGHPKVIATGGLSEIISQGTDKIDTVDADLTLKGLKIIYEGRGK